MVSTDAFRSASALFVDVVERVPDDAWDRPALGDWDVRGLVGHTARAFITVLDYLALDAPSSVSIETAGDYYGSLYLVYTNPESIHRRGVDVGRSLGDDPVSAIRVLRDRALALVEGQPAGRLVSIGGMGIPLDEYLQTRVFELVVHTMDLGRAVDVAVPVPPALVEATATLAAAIAARTGKGEQLLLALTGRTPLPSDFSVV
ncbi:maleylpyruvate isomerase family mycothiol-dependent enzyme [Labedella endophytica]|uniref:Maleylpyruvate isomerase family mycothiol-dependent enzyme n=1 Tax=Labedella endophytica TaxID=1523160 RepID=A0A433JT45_9MICO|nr:maleylpyruvate isomerase family mycothiol-dependent enzyme [Labedella endophytica]RUR01572.1 maleylpyruvate isomerase family mycothiol-dependent enzyme [Labedella endophytica]